MRDMRVEVYFTIILMITLTGCSSFLEIPPIPEHPKNVNDELKYIYKTDQKDRRAILMKVLFQKEVNYMKNDKVLAVSDRDSIRLSRVIYLNNEGLITSDQAKFCSGFIYLHGGGAKMVDDSMYLRRSTELFEEIMKYSTERKLIKRSRRYYQEGHDLLR